MTLSTLQGVLQTIGIPVYYLTAGHNTAAPYIVFRDYMKRNFSASGSSYMRRSYVDIALYTNDPNDGIREQVYATLNDVGFSPSETMRYEDDPSVIMTAWEVRLDEC